MTGLLGGTVEGGVWEWARAGNVSRYAAWQRWPWRANELDEIWTGSLPVEDRAGRTRYARRWSKELAGMRNLAASAERHLLAMRDRWDRQYAWMAGDDPAEWRPYQPGELIRVEVEAGSTAPSPSVPPT